MSKNTGDVRFHVWGGKDINAMLHEEVQLPGGGTVRGEIGPVTIKSGDIVHLTHGSSFGKSTRSGIGFEAEYPYGKILLGGTGANVVLDNTNNNDVKTETASYDDYNARIAKQVERVQPEIENAKEEYIIATVLRRERLEASRSESDKKAKEKINGALEQMNAVFGRKPGKP